MKKICVVIAALLLLSTWCGAAYAAKAFFIIPMQGGSPNFDEIVKYQGYVLIGETKGYGMYQISGEQKDLDNIATLKNVVLLGAKTDTALKEKMSSTTVSKVDAFMKEKSIPVTVTAARDNGDVILDIAKKFEPLVKTLNDHYIRGLPEDETKGVINEKIISK